MIKLSKNEIKTIATMAGMAPSGGNMQPWKLEFDKNVLKIYIDEKRSNSFLDVGKFASAFALGCLLENIKITADSLGLVYKTKLNEYKDKKTPLIVVNFIKRNKKRNGSNQLFKCIPKRVTNRQIHDGTILSEKIIDQLKSQVKKTNNNFKLSATSKLSDKKALANILGIADGIRSTNPNTLKQLIEEFRWTQKDVEKTRDGIDLKTLELPGNLEKVLFLLKKTPSISKIVPRKVFENQAKPILVGCSHLCCLSFKQPIKYKTVITAGQIMEKIWLLATKEKLAIQPWSIAPFFLIRVKLFKGRGFNNKEIEKIKKIEKDLKKAFNLNFSDFPMFIFRISKAKPPTKRALKLNWKDYTIIR